MLYRHGVMCMQSGSNIIGFDSAPNNAALHLHPSSSAHLSPEDVAVWQSVHLLFTNSKHYFLLISGISMITAMSDDLRVMASLPVLPGPSTALCSAVKVVL